MTNVAESQGRRDPRTALAERFGAESIPSEETADGMPTCIVEPRLVPDVLRFLKHEIEQPYPMLYDLTAVDERARQRSTSRGDFTIVYQLLSFERNEDVRIKVPLEGMEPSLPTQTRLWPCANWYEREVWDMFGIRFDGHPNLTRLLMPSTWRGHPLRKEHPARATEMERPSFSPEWFDREEAAQEIRPSDWGTTHVTTDDLVVLNVGPQHPGTHGVLRVALKLDGEEIVDALPVIGYHHRGAEKMAERQTWHTFLPYTDRVDYLAGVSNNLPYVLAVETLAGIEVPARAQRIRVLLTELFRIASHLVWYGTFAQDLGALSPVFYMFNDRERLLDVVSAITGDRMHPNWFRIGGVAQDLPRGWDVLLRDFLDEFRGRLEDYGPMVMQNRILRARSIGVGAYTREEAIEWGVTGSGLRACGFAWDWRKERPYSGYDQLEFEVPTADAGDVYARALVRAEEMRQSVRILEQCLADMPPGRWLADHPLTTPPEKARTMRDIETLIHHFLAVGWGPVIPPGEAFQAIEAPKGSNGYYAISDGETKAYRMRIRTPSFPHLQMLPEITRGARVPDLLAVLGSIDYVLADVDR